MIESIILFVALRLLQKFWSYYLLFRINSENTYILHHPSQYWHARWLTPSCVVSESGSVTVIHHVDLHSPLGNCMWLSCAFAHTPRT